MKKKNLWIQHFYEDGQSFLHVSYWARGEKTFAGRTAIRAAIKRLRANAERRSREYTAVLAAASQIERLRLGSLSIPASTVADAVYGLL